MSQNKILILSLQTAFSYYFQTSMFRVVLSVSSRSVCRCLSGAVVCVLRLLFSVTPKAAAVDPHRCQGPICGAVLHTCRAPHRCVPLTCHSPAAFDSSERFLCSLTFLSADARSRAERLTLWRLAVLSLMLVLSAASLVFLCLCDPALLVHWTAMMFLVPATSSHLILFYLKKIDNFNFNLFFN